MILPLVVQQIIHIYGLQGRLIHSLHIQGHHPRSNDPAQGISATPTCGSWNSWIFYERIATIQFNNKIPPFTQARRSPRCRPSRTDLEPQAPPQAPPPGSHYPTFPVGEAYSISTTWPGLIVISSVEKIPLDSFPSRTSKESFFGPTIASYLLAEQHIH